MGELSKKLKKKGAKIPKRRKKPLWAGPEDNTREGGVTQSMLSTYQGCKERFRLKVIEGLGKQEQFEKALEYGNMWHLCEEEHHSGRDHGPALKAYARKLIKQYSDQQEDIAKWYHVCDMTFPIYVDFLAKLKSKRKKVEPVCSEEVFNIPYKLPSGRTVFLRGKFDSVDYEIRKLKGKTQKSLCLQENKTKGLIDEELMRRQLMFDHQTMFYIIALEALRKEPVRNLVYNVIRRPLSGGRHSIKQKKNQSQEEYYDELRDRIAGEPEFFFFRWDVQVDQEDVDRYKHTYLNPLLHNLCYWYDHVSSCFLENRDPFEGSVTHWRSPYGLYNPLTNGRPTIYDSYLVDGKEVGLTRDVKLFRELEE